MTGAAAAVSLAATSAQSVAQDSAGELRDKVNANTVTILSGNPNGTYLYIASDISFVLDKGDEMRVVPMVGKGGAQNVRDLIFLRGVDMAIVRSDALGAFNDNPVYGDLGSQLRYITRLYNEEMHVLTRKDITSLSQLDGKRVNLSDVGSGTQLTSRLIFEKLGVEPVELNMSQRDGFEKLKAGEIDATVLVAGKPSRSWKGVEIDREKYHLLPVTWDEPLQDVYLPSELTSKDYPNLIAPGESIETVSAGAILAAYNWKKGTKRYQRLERFVDAFFSNIDKFKGPARHPKWQETNIAAPLPGWTRFEPAEEWLADEKNIAEVSERDAFENFVADSAGDNAMSKEERDKLFEEFMRWRQADKPQSGKTQSASK